MNPRLQPNLWAPGKTTVARGKGRLTKLHGSVDWAKGFDDEIIYGQKRFVGQHSDRVIIYPGYKGTPNNPPFDLFHQHFANCVSEATVVIVIGFAFRDEPINRVFDTQLKRGARLLVVNPGAGPFGPLRVQAEGEHLRVGFAEAHQQIITGVRRH